MKNFGGISINNSDFKNSKIVIIPVAYDATSTWIKGADRGPKAILEASANMELYDAETDSEVYREGIYTGKLITEKKSPESLVKKVEDIVFKNLEKNKFPVIIGGEHSVSVGAVYAQAKKNKNLSVLQLDAHMDTREVYEGSKYNHACVMARVKKICPAVQVGIRSLDISEKKNIDPERVFLAESIIGKNDWHKKVVAKLSKKVYITIDLDVFDPAFVPSTGTPEPGGFSWYEVINFLREVFEKREVVGFDVVELCPNSKEKSSDFLAAKLIYKLLSYKYYFSKK